MTTVMKNLMASACLLLAGCTTILNARFNGDSGVPDSFPSGSPIGDEVQVLNPGSPTPIVGSGFGGSLAILPPSLFTEPRGDGDNYTIRYLTNTDYDADRNTTVTWDGRWYGTDRMECRLGGLLPNGQFRYAATVRFASGHARTYHNGSWMNVAPITDGGLHSVRLRYYANDTYFVAIQQQGVPEGRYPSAGTIAAVAYGVPGIEQTERLMLHCVFLDPKIPGNPYYRYVMDDVLIRQNNN